MDASEFINPAHEQMLERRTGEVLTITELSKITGYANKCIREELQAGAPLAVKGGPGREHKLDSAKFITWLVRKERNRLINLFMQRTAQGDGKYEKGNFKARRAAAQAELAEIEVQEKRGQLVSIDLVTTVLQRLITNAKARLLILPTKAAPQAAALKDPVGIKNFLEGLIYESLSELSAITPADLVSSEVLETLESAAEIDGEPMGGPVPQVKSRGKRRAGAVENVTRSIPA